MEKNCNFVNLSTEMKLKYLVTHECKLLGAFISNCWNTRTQILYFTHCKLVYNMIQCALFILFILLHEFGCSCHYNK